MSSIICAKCENVITSNKSLICSGDCKNSYHMDCVSIPESSYYQNLTIELKSKWKCSNCDPNFKIIKLNEISSEEMIRIQNNRLSIETSTAGTSKSLTTLTANEKQEILDKVASSLVSEEVDGLIDIKTKLDKISVKMDLNHEYTEKVDKLNETLDFIKEQHHRKFTNQDSKLEETMTNLKHCVTVVEHVVISNNNK